jgi:hypothetical protein
MAREVPAITPGKRSSISRMSQDGDQRQAAHQDEARRIAANIAHAAGAGAPGDISFVNDQIKSLSQKRKT